MKILLKARGKQLIITENSKIYQKENVVDKLLFFIPDKYQDISLEGFLWTLTYVDSQGTLRTESLTLSDTVEKEGFFVYTLDVDTKVTRYNGVITLYLTGTHVDPDTMQKYVLKTASLQITVDTWDSLYDFVPDEALESIDQKMLQLDAKIQAVEAMEDRVLQSVPDDLGFDDDSYLHLLVDGNVIGDGVQIERSPDDTDGTYDGIIDIEKAESSGVPGATQPSIIDVGNTPSGDTTDIDTEGVMPIINL